jgi:two-component system, response regulator PdtaR
MADHPVKILLAEDEALIALALSMELNNAGYKVCEKVNTGEAAIEGAKKKIADVLLLDIRLAGKLDGIQAARKIRQFSNVPIIFMSGYHNIDKYELSKSVNPLAYLIKPVNVQDLQPILEKIRNRV